MSLMFMLFALMGAVVVLAGGSYVLREVLARMEPRSAVAEPEPPPAEVPRPHVGGYVPVDREVDELPSGLRERARNLVALDRADEAVRLLRPHLDGDEERARRALRRLDGDGRPALES
ncbi:hypothetical protein [Nocardiopsis alba]|uniref:hypothetical protein n=1 Tax=Nocardiopsis alba TaxID=53437 RepID=UPI0035E263EB